MSAFYFHWAGPNDIVHKTDARYDVLEGITSSYQFFMLRQGAALMRLHSCWCPACFTAAMAGTGEGTFIKSEYLVPGCVHIEKEGAALYEWQQKLPGPRWGRGWRTRLACQDAWTCARGAEGAAGGVGSRRVLRGRGGRDVARKNRGVSIP